MQKIKIYQELSKYGVSDKAISVYSTLAMMIVRARFSKNYNITAEKISEYRKECPKTIKKYLTELQQNGLLQIIVFKNTKAAGYSSQSAYYLYSFPQNITQTKYFTTDKVLSNKELYKYFEPDKGFLMIDTTILEDNYLTLTDISVALLIEKAKSKSNGRAYLTKERFLSELNCKYYALKKSLYRLKKHCHIKRTRDTKKRSTVYFYEIISTIKIEKLKQFFEENKKKVQAVIFSFNCYIKDNSKKIKRSDARTIEKVLNKILSLRTDEQLYVKDYLEKSEIIMYRLANSLTLPKLKRLAIIMSMEKYKKIDIYKALGVAI